MKFTSTSNPVLSEKAFEALSGEGTMSIKGTLNKSIILFLLLLVSASFSWKLATYDLELLSPLMWGGAIVGFILAMVTIFAKKFAKFTAPVYAIAQGFFLGSISMMYNTLYSGIVLQAVLITFGIMAVMLVLFRSGIIKVTNKFRSGVIIATGGIALVYLVSFILGFFGIQIPYLHSGGPIGIGISIFIIIIAALNLILDFNFIQESCERGAPKEAEWFAAFGLMVTLVWLYLEVLRLLSYLNKR
ncbi:MAG TPA: Bax inhibitor-1/YccA family protein [Bacteroidales bacterium]|nr:Bax inhibitor-1/YccA family protein [Bacteroidales bacterium]HPL04358.1 Bax inhibitor-1/YccA family protein [Bacteroidales bacterium]